MTHIDETVPAGWRWRHSQSFGKAEEAWAEPLVQGSLMPVWIWSLKPRFLSSSDLSWSHSLSLPQQMSLMEYSCAMHRSGLNRLQ